MDTNTYGLHKTDKLLQELCRHNLLKSLIKRQVEAEKVAEIELSEEAISNTKKAWLDSKGINDDNKYQFFLCDNGISEEDFEWQVCLQARIQAYCDEHYRHNAEAHFLARKDQLDVVVYSLLRVRDKNLAHELYLRIKEREATFGDLAAHYAEGPEKNTQGIIGPVPLTQAHPKLAECLRTIKPGKLMVPLNIENWWVVARLESYTPASFDEVTAQQMSMELFNTWITQETTQRIRQITGTGVEY